VRQSCSDDMDERHARFFSHLSQRRRCIEQMVGRGNRNDIRFDVGANVEQMTSERQ
jgi:hypothetical protein